MNEIVIGKTSGLLLGMMQLLSKCKITKALYITQTDRSQMEIVKTLQQLYKKSEVDKVRVVSLEKWQMDLNGALTNAELSWNTSTEVFVDHYVYESI